MLTIDAFAVALTKQVLRFRWLTLLGLLIFVAITGFGIGKIEFSSDYRIFFGDKNPQLVAFEKLEKIYTKTDNIMLVVREPNKGIFQPQVLQAIQEITEESWRLPFVTRVDSITNYQHTVAVGDDLIVGDLVENAPNTYTASQLKNLEKIALGEPSIRGRLISADAKTTGVNATIRLNANSPRDIEKIVFAARTLHKEIKEKYPDVEIVLSGMAMLSNAFVETSMEDMKILVPIMYITLLVMLGLFLRSFVGVLVTFCIMIFSIITAMGLAGWFGIPLTPIMATAPTIIITLAVADSVHVLVSIFKEMRHGMDKVSAIIESIRINFQPVLLTSITTAIGFLSLNFSDSPPFNHLGNTTAMGVMAALFFSIVLLPIIVSFFPLKVGNMKRKDRAPYMEKLSDFVIKRKNKLFYGVGGLAILIMLATPKIELNDQFVKYFKPSAEFRQDVEYMMEHLSGIYTVEYSVGAKDSGGISEPEYLANLEKFAVWLEKQPEVQHVFSITDVFKKLNKSMHGDDDSWYKIPASRNLAAQYMLMYEMSLPYGLDLNDRINVDKSASRLTATLHDTPTKEFHAFNARASKWQQENLPNYMVAEATSPMVMFSNISKRNVESMLSGNLVAIVLISFLIGLMLRSVKIGVFSLLPNLLPIGVAFGIWALYVGQVNMAAATVVATALGIVVDDTIHFLSKYFRARREKKLSAEKSIAYAFATVGPALIITTFTLVLGFAVLAFSNFQPNQYMGLLTSIAIMSALIIDFFVLPTALLKFDKETKKGK